uniref:Uncharacterized protein n=1 Tax=Lygus hesperus TaxID=30085 RepID=A0A146L349_LYGHE
MFVSTLSALTPMPPTTFVVCSIESTYCTPLALFLDSYPTIDSTISICSTSYGSHRCTTDPVATISIHRSTTLSPQTCTQVLHLRSRTTMSSTAGRVACTTPIVFPIPLPYSFSTLYTLPTILHSFRFLSRILYTISTPAIAPTSPLFYFYSPTYVPFQHPFPTVHRTTRSTQTSQPPRSTLIFLYDFFTSMPCRDCVSPPSDLRTS